MAGNVSVSVSHGNLLITGDNVDNFVEVFGTGTANQFTVEGFIDNHGVNTTINHSASPQTFSGVTNITVNLKRGDDFFGFEQGNLSGNLKVDMAEGNDEVNVGVPKTTTTAVSSATATPLAVRPLATTTSTSAATIGGSLYINLGSGNNWLIESSTHVKQSECISACDGNDRIQLTDNGTEPGDGTIGSGVTIDRDLTLNLGGGTNYFEGYDLTVGGSLKMCAWGQDTVELSALNVTKDAVFDLWWSKASQSFAINPEPSLDTPPEGVQSHVGRDLVVNTGWGSDHVNESSLSVGGSNKINTDGGDDTVDMGDATDYGYAANCQVTVGKDLIVKLGSGKDSLNSDNVRVSGGFSIWQDWGNATIQVDDVVVTHLLKISTDGGKDSVTMHGVTAETAQVYLGSGNDTLSVSNTTVSHSTLFDGGTGTNTYTDGGGNSLAGLTKRHFS